MSSYIRHIDFPLQYVIMMHCTVFINLREQFLGLILSSYHVGLQCSLVTSRLHSRIGGIYLDSAYHLVIGDIIIATKS